MDGRLVQRARDHLHRILVFAVAPDRFDVAPPAQHQPVPVRQSFLGERIGITAVEVDHQFRDPSFGGRNAALLGLEAELAAQRYLDAIAVEQFALDLRGLDRLVGHHVENDARAVLFAQVLHHADHDARLLQETCLERGKSIAVPAKIGPVRLLPVPLHEALTLRLCLTLCLILRYKSTIYASGGFERVWQQAFRARS